MAHRPLVGAREAAPRAFRAAFFSALGLGLVVVASPASGQVADPARPSAPPPSAAPFPGARDRLGPSVRPVVPPAPSPGGLPSLAPGASPAPGPSEGPAVTEEETPPGTPAATPSPTGKPRVKVRADSLSSDRQHGLTTFRGNVRVDYGDVGIDAEELSVDQHEQVIFTDTRFTLAQPDPKNKGQKQIVTGTGLRYHYDTEEGLINNANLSTPAETPGQTIYIRAKTLSSFGKDHFEGQDTVFSTCKEILNEQVPHYHVETRHLQYFAGDKIVAWDNKVYLNGRYTFWLPVWVIPLKGERNSLNVGRTDVEGFYLRSFYGYALPSLNGGYWMNDGRLITNLFEKKGVGLGVEHTARWGYSAATYGFFYGLITPDRNNFLPYGQDLSESEANAAVKQGQALYGLSNAPFDDRQWGLEHKQRLFGNMEVGGRIEDHNIYDPLSQNARNDRRSVSLDVKDRIEQLGGFNYSIGYDGTESRGNQSITKSLNQSLSDRIKGDTGFKIANTDFRLSTQYDLSRTRTRGLVSGTVQADDEAAPPVDYKVETIEGAKSTRVGNNFNASSQWSAETQSTVAVPYNIEFREPAPPTPPPPGSTASPAPLASPSPWTQNVEPRVSLTHRMKDVGTVSVEGQKFFDITQLPAVTSSPVPLEKQVQNVKAQGRFDRLPEVTLTSEQLLQQYQPFQLKMGYGRFFEYSSFKLPTGFKGTQLDRYFPGDYINRLNPEATLSSKAFPIGFRSKLDFGGTGYRQFFYSTKDSQYSIDERLRLSTDWSEKISTSFNYTNNLTPDPKVLGAGPGTPTNNSPFQQDRLSLTKQTRLTGTFDVRNEPFFNYALRGGYDYQNRLYDNLSSEISWRSALLGLPLGLTLNGQYDVFDDPTGGLKLEKKELDVRYLPRVPTFGIAGKWLPVTGTFTMRSTPDLFGGAFGSDKILPGWQFDNAMSYDFEKGLWNSLQNRVYVTFGRSWQSHLQFMLGGYYDTEKKQYKFSTIGLSKDLHDFILSFQYDSLASFYSLSLTMVAFPQQPLSFTSNTFDRRSTAGGSAAIGGTGSPF